MMTFQQTLNALQSVKIQVVDSDLRIYGELSPLLQDAVNYWRVNLVEHYRLKATAEDPTVAEWRRNQLRRVAIDPFEEC